MLAKDQQTSVSNNTYCACVIEGGAGGGGGGGGGRGLMSFFLPIKLLFYSIDLG